MIQKTIRVITAEKRHSEFGITDEQIVFVDMCQTDMCPPQDWFPQGYVITNDENCTMQLPGSFPVNHVFKKVE